MSLFIVVWYGWIDYSDDRRSRRLIMGATDLRSEATKRNVSHRCVISKRQLTATRIEWKQLFPQDSGCQDCAASVTETADGKSTSVVIMLADQADVSAADTMKDQDARGWYVYNTLTQHAARTQVGLQEFLKSQGVSLPIVLGGQHARCLRRSPVG